MSINTTNYIFFQIEKQREKTGWFDNKWKKKTIRKILQEEILDLNWGI